MKLQTGAAREGFFFYLLGNTRDREHLLRAHLRTTTGRKEVISEVSDLVTLLTNDLQNPRYIPAAQYWSYRLATNGCPNELITDEGMKAYQDYLIITANIHISELGEYLRKRKQI